MRFYKSVFKILFLSFLMGLLLTAGTTRVQAADKPDKPQITLTESKDGKTIKVTISATEGADGYKIYIKGTEDTKFKALKTIKKDGSEERSFTIKKLDVGKYSIRVKAYAKVDGKTVWSSYSKTKKAQIGENESVEEKTEDPQEQVKEPDKETEKEPESAAVEVTEPEVKRYDFSAVKAGDIIQFGSYEQDNIKKNGKEPIEWIVLERTEDELFLLSRYLLDQMYYHKPFENVTWENCSIRNWLNDDFYNSAFNDVEKEMIKTSLVKNEDNPLHGTDGGNDTYDKVFLLSIADMVNPDYGFSPEYQEQDMNRRCTATTYAIARGVGKRTKEEYQTLEGTKAFYWWLRSPGAYADHAVTIGVTGWVGTYGPGVYGESNKSDEGVRPAMWIKVNP